MEVSCAVRRFFKLLGFKGLNNVHNVHNVHKYTP